MRLPHVLDWLGTAAPDVLALQETMLVDENFPGDAIREAGYEGVFTGQKTYNGVALLARSEISDVEFESPETAEGGKRVVKATVDGVRVINLYVVNGQSVGSEKYDYKLSWLDHIIDEVRAPADEDVHDPEAWHEAILCSSPERAKLRALLDAGLKDTFRLFEQPDSTFSWWDYRQGGFRRNRGMRIDLVLASTALAKRCTAAGIDAGPRRLERPSDHAPVYAEFDHP